MNLKIFYYLGGMLDIFREYVVRPVWTLGLYYFIRLIELFSHTTDSQTQDIGNRQNNFQTPASDGIEFATCWAGFA